MFFLLADRDLVLLLLGESLGKYSDALKGLSSAADKLLMQLLEES